MCFSALASAYAKLIPYFPSAVTIFMEILQGDVEKMLKGLSWRSRRDPQAGADD
jgi:hypothetical protein